MGPRGSWEEEGGWGRGGGAGNGTNNLCTDVSGPVRQSSPFFFGLTFSLRAWSVGGYQEDPREKEREFLFTAVASVHKTHPTPRNRCRRRRRRRRRRWAGRPPQGPAGDALQGPCPVLPGPTGQRPRRRSLLLRRTPRPLEERRPPLPLT